MEVLPALMDGFATAATPINLLWCLVGVTLGTAIGILPGIGPALTIALLLPVTAKLDPTGAFIMFAGLYYGAMYGSSTTSILLNTPGESGSIQFARRVERRATSNHCFGLRPEYLAPLSANHHRTRDRAMHTGDLYRHVAVVGLCRLVR